MKSPWFVTALSSALVSLAMHTSAATPTLDEVIKAKRDLWGEAAMVEPNGPSYEFFEKLLPPPRYVNADFGYYPIVLSAPGAKVKARLIANGMGLNLRGGGRQWRDNGTPVLFRVGPDELSFGKFQQKLQEPVLAEGHLPIVSIRYLHQTPILAEGMVPLTQERVDRVSEVYELEAFASTEPALAEKGMVFVKFALAEGTTGMITVQVDSGNALELEDGKVTDSAGQVLAYLDSHWAKSLDNNGKWRQPFVQAKLTPGKVVTIAIPTRPLESNFALRDGDYDTQRALCAGAWKKILSKATRVETPEQIVNDAWRHLLIQNFELINNNRMHYSHGNQYDALYEGEGSDAAMALMVWGYEETMRELMGPLFEFTRKGLEFHQAGFKLNNICRYYWQTRDSSVFDEYRASWQREAERLDKNRTGEHGLFPPEQYCGDIHTKVQSLNPNSKAWRAMRDLGATLDDIGETKLAAHYSSVAKDFRQTVLTAIQKSVNNTTTPPFVPIALYTNEPAHSPICDVRIGSYWNIIIGYTLSSGIFPVGGPEENWIPHYQEQHGGLCMGMLRSGGMSNTWWNTEYKLNPLYGTRYALDALRRDEPERALVAFYGMLA